MFATTKWPCKLPSGPFPWLHSVLEFVVDTLPWHKACCAGGSWIQWKRSNHMDPKHLGTPCPEQLTTERLPRGGLVSAPKTFKNRGIYNACRGKCSPDLGAKNNPHVYIDHRCNIDLSSIATIQGFQNHESKLALPSELPWPSSWRCLHGHLLDFMVLDLALWLSVSCCLPPHAIWSICTGEL